MNCERIDHTLFMRSILVEVWSAPPPPDNDAPNNNCVPHDFLAGGSNNFHPYLCRIFRVQVTLPGGPPRPDLVLSLKDNVNSLCRQIVVRAFRFWTRCDSFQLTFTWRNCPC